MKDWQESEPSVHNDAEPNPCDHNLENGKVDAEQEHCKAGEEEEKGDMEQNW